LSAQLSCCWFIACLFRACFVVVVCCCLLLVSFAVVSKSLPCLLCLGLCVVVALHLLVLFVACFASSCIVSTLFSNSVVMHLASCISLFSFSSPNSPKEELILHQTFANIPFLCALQALPNPQRLTRDHYLSSERAVGILLGSFGASVSKVKYPSQS
jgi:hypothetical protein